MNVGISLNEITARVADALDRPFDDMFIERVKSSILTSRAMFIRRDSEKNNISKEFLQRFKQNLITVDKNDPCAEIVKCPILRTENKISVPIRPKDQDSLFKYIGSIDGYDSFTYTDLEELRFTRTNTYTGKAIRYHYANGYIYIFNNLKIKKILIEGIFVNPRLVGVSCDGVACGVDEDEAFPIGADMIEPIVNMIIEGIVKLPEIQQQDIEIDPSDGKEANTKRRR